MATSLRVVPMKTIYTWFRLGLTVVFFSPGSVQIHFHCSYQNNASRCAPRDSRCASGLAALVLNRPLQHSSWCLMMFYCWPHELYVRDVYWARYLCFYLNVFFTQCIFGTTDLHMILDFKDAILLYLFVIGTFLVIAQPEVNSIYL